MTLTSLVVESNDLRGGKCLVAGEGHRAHKAEAGAIQRIALILFLTQGIEFLTHDEVI